MAKVSSIQKNKNRKRLCDKYALKRSALKDIINNKDLPLEERFKAQLKISELPRNSSKIRLRNRCQVTGRPRGYYRKFRLSRNMVREMGSFGLVPGLTKASW